MKSKAFVNRVLEIAKTNPTYRTRGTGMDGTCDCIGLVMGAMYALGHSEYPMHSSNYFARREVDNLLRMDAMEDDLHPGMLLFKARSDVDPRYDLHERYRQGGRYFTGDVLDYYHVGVVTGVNPLDITHCTSTGNVNGITHDVTTRGWTHVGSLKGITYDEEDEPMATYQAAVTAPSGKTVNMRARPADGEMIVARVPVGTEVTVLESADGWAKIDYKGKYGYMMSRYLQEAGMSVEERLSALEDMVNELYMLVGGEKSGA